MSPTTRARRAEIHAHTNARTNLVTLRVLNNQLEFREIFNDRNNCATKFGGQRDELNVARLFKTVAHDQALWRVAGHSKHGEKLWLAAHFKAKSKLHSVLANFLHHTSLLIHLDGIHANVFALVVVLFDGVGERLVNIVQALF